MVPDTLRVAFVLIAPLMPFGALARKLLVDETLECVEGMPWLIVNVAAHILRLGECANFLTY